MPQKGFFTQGVAMLMKAAPDLGAVAVALQRFGPFQATAPVEGGHWSIAGAGLAAALPAELPGGGPDGVGRLVIDRIDQPWPDDMGNPQTSPELFMAWGTGHFGPFTWPRALERAVQCAWFLEKAEEVVPTHKACLRVRITYATDPKPEAALFPEGYQPVAELQFLADVVTALFDLPDTLCYFNANGELLMGRSTFVDKLAFDREKGILPADLFCNVRVVPTPEGAILVDTVGLDQFDLTDQEAVFPRDKVRPDEAANFLFGVAHFLNSKGDVIRNRHTMNSSPQLRWIVHHMTAALMTPPRETMRWLPDQWVKPPLGVFDPAKVDAEG